MSTEIEKRGGPIIVFDVTQVDMLNQGEGNRRMEGTLAVKSTQYPKDKEMGAQQEW